MTRECAEKLAQMLECSYPDRYMLRNHEGLVGTLGRIFTDFENRETIEAFDLWIKTSEFAPKFSNIIASIKKTKNKVAAPKVFTDTDGFTYQWNEEIKDFDVIGRPPHAPWLPLEDWKKFGIEPPEFIKTQIKAESENETHGCVDKA